MTKVQLLNELYRITSGINKMQTESIDGWWETSTGAEFGEKVLRDLENLILEMEIA